MITQMCSDPKSLFLLDMTVLETYVDTMKILTPSIINLFMVMLTSIPSTQDYSSENEIAAGDDANVVGFDDSDEDQAADAAAEAAAEAAEAAAEAAEAAAEAADGVDYRLLDEWFPLTSDVNNAIYFMKYKNIRNSDNQNPTAWVKSEHSKDKTVEYREKLRLIRFDCINNKLSILTSIAYKADGNILSQFDGDGSSIYIVPDSIGESFAAFACPASK